MDWQVWRDQFMFAPWKLALWVIWAATFGILEGLGVKDPENWPTLTYLCRHAVPDWGLAMFVGWLVLHFVVQANK